jgi:hypothetical protein
MKRRCLSVTLILIVGTWQISILPAVSLAQFPEDALRFATPGFGVGARSLGMGNAYTGVANDYTALYWNPAGLAQLQYGEFSFGLSHLNHRDGSTFFGNQISYNNSTTNLNSFGLAYPAPVRRGNFVVAFGYQRQSNFTTGTSFNGFNPSGSIIQSWARDGARYPSDLSDNIAYQIFLANIDTNTGRFESPIKNRVTQLGTVIEGGGLDNWSAAVAVDIAKNVSGGMTLTYLSGSYKYERNYKEQDNDGIWNSFPFDFDQLILDEFVNSDLSGLNATFGLMYRDPEKFRLGLTVKTPTSFRVKETFGSSARAYFDDGDVRPTDGPFKSEGRNEYDVNTPWVFGGGVSFILRDLVLAADVQYTDWTQLEFSDANSDLVALNKDLKRIFRPTANLRGGLEYDLRNAGVRLRGGFIYNTSPFEGDPSSYDQKYVTAGLGVLLGGSTMLDLAYARGWWETRIANYYDPVNPSVVNEKITTNNFIMTVSYRF